MPRTLTYALFFLFVISGCVSLDPEEVQAPKAPEPIAAPTPPAPVDLPSNQTASTTSTTPHPTPSRAQIQMLQARLKAAGFYAGALDGIAGPKTRSGMLRLQSACANLKDLLETSNNGILQAKAEAQTAKQDSAVISSANPEEIRLIQVRLKDAGFDPGPIDGIMGAKTNATLLRFQAGCTMLTNLYPTLNKVDQTTDSQSSPSFVRERKQLVVAKSFATESGKMNAVGKQILGSEKIRQEQLHLREAGFDPGPIDGILGPKTRAAMQRYQKSLDLKNSK
jgi:peptidoglycan hydrolase-like protein with peptidoglycan-binding domain